MIRDFILAFLAFAIWLYSETIVDYLFGVSS